MCQEFCAVKHKITVCAVRLRGTAVACHQQRRAATWSAAGRGDGSRAKDGDLMPPRRPESIGEIGIEMDVLGESDFVAD
jgi:hypothetical protein